MGRTALYIHAKDGMDLGDVVKIARAEGKKALNTNRNVRILHSFRFESDFVVVVESEESFKAPVVGVEGDK